MYIWQGEEGNHRNAHLYVDSLRAVHDLVSEALGNRLDVTERTVARASADEVDGLVHATQRRDIHGLTPDDTCRSRWLKGGVARLLKDMYKPRKAGGSINTKQIHTKKRTQRRCHYSMRCGRWSGSALGLPLTQK